MGLYILQLLKRKRLTKQRHNAKLVESQVATLAKYNLSGEKIGSADVSEELSKAEANTQMIKDYIVAIRENQRQWSANTKGRSEVAHTTAKPHKQKGTGRARQGMLVAPQYRGGGRVFGPKPKFDQHVRINKKERKAAIRCLIGEKIRAGRFHLIDSTELNEPKTKTLAALLKQSGAEGKRALFLGEGEYVEIEHESDLHKINVKCSKHTNFIKSLRNIPKVNFSLAKNISGYDVMIAHDIYATPSALEELEAWLCNEQ